MWRWQFGCKDAWTPEFTDRFGWLVKIKLVQKELLVCISVGSSINWANLFEEVCENNFDPSVVSISLDHHEEDLALKSPVITDKNGLCLFMLLKSFSKLGKNKATVCWYLVHHQTCTCSYSMLILVHTN